MTSASSSSPGHAAAPQSWPAALAILGWLGLIALGVASMLFYENSPGRSAAAPAAWPRDCGLHASSDHPTVLLFAHPRCPCSEASVTALVGALSEPPGMKATIVFFEPAGAGPEWRKTSLWVRTKSNPKFAPIPDPDGALARAFGVHTSGEILVYRADGTLAFEGGITQGRGAGASDGALALARVLRNELAWASGSPVFGCEIDRPSPASACAPEDNR